MPLYLTSFWPHSTEPLREVRNRDGTPIWSIHSPPISLPITHTPLGCAKKQENSQRMRKTERKEKQSNQVITSWLYNVIKTKSTFVTEHIIKTWVLQHFISLVFIHNNSLDGHYNPDSRIGNSVNCNKTHFCLDVDYYILSLYWHFLIPLGIRKKSQGEYLTE